MKKLEASYFQDFKEAVISHHLRSGEIILDIWEHDKSKYQIPEVFDELILTKELQCAFPQYELTEISKKEAIESIKYGLSTKVNYTAIDRPFTNQEQNKYAHGFLDFFHDGQFYTTAAWLYQKELDLNDFWEVGGAIVGDDKKIGLFWINDLYDKF